jgi:putative flippase GtrA
MRTALIDRRRREVGRFLKFSVVGVIGAVIDFGSFNLFANVIGIASVIASILSFSAAVTSNFIWNRFWTYPDSRSKTIRQQALQFALISLVGLIIRTPIFALSEKPLILLLENVPDSTFVQSLPGWVPSQVFEANIMGGNLALALAVVIVLFWNFFANRLWTYSDAE